MAEFGQLPGEKAQEFASNKTLFEQQLSLYENNAANLQLDAIVSADVFGMQRYKRWFEIGLVTSSTITVRELRRKVARLHWEDRLSLPFKGDTKGITELLNILCLDGMESHWEYLSLTKSEYKQLIKKQRIARGVTTKEELVESLRILYVSNMMNFVWRRIDKEGIHLLLERFGLENLILHFEDLQLFQNEYRAFVRAGHIIEGKTTFIQFAQILAELHWSGELETINQMTETSIARLAEVYGFQGKTHRETLGLTDSQYRTMVRAGVVIRGETTVAELQDLLRRIQSGEKIVVGGTVLAPYRKKSFSKILSENTVI